MSDVFPGVHAHRFAPVPAERAESLERWSRFPVPGEWFPTKLGLEMLEVRDDYCRLLLRHRPDHQQPAGVVHGGVFATLIDTVVVPAIGVGYPDERGFSTIDLATNYLGAVVDEDLVVEGWVRQRGKSIAFCEAEIHTSPQGRLVTTGTATYRIFGPR